MNLNQFHRIKTIFSFSLLFAICLTSNGQERDSTKDNGVRIRLDGPNSSAINKANSPLFVISVDGKRIQIPEDGNFMDSVAIANTFDLLNPGWIQSIEVLKGSDAIKKYDSLGKNGVILINLKKEVLRDLPDELKRKFKHD